jgi:hypothetical protein
VTDYLATVTTDRAAGWRRLTPAFRAASGGFAGYRSFWSTISSARANGIVADPVRRTVSYTVHYTRTNGSTSNGRVTLRLVGSGDNLRIAGES